MDKYKFIAAQFESLNEGQVNDYMPVTDLLDLMQFDEDNCIDNSHESGEQWHNAEMPGGEFWADTFNTKLDLEN